MPSYDPAKSEPHWQAAWDRAVETQTAYECEHRIRMADGTYRWHLSRAERGEPQGVAQWYGTATESTPITLHLASDEPEAVTRFLLERRIPYHLVDRHCRFPRGDAADMPCFEVEIAGEAFDLVVFPTAGSRRMPLSSLDDKPVRRVAAAELGALLDSGQLFTDGLAALG